MEIRNEKVIRESDWSDFVTATYQRPYQFQQQDGCRGRGLFRLTVPDEGDDDTYPDTVPEIVYSGQRGVNFAAWLARDPAQPLPVETTKVAR